MASHNVDDVQKKGEIFLSEWNNGQKKGDRDGLKSGSLPDLNVDA